MKNNENYQIKQSVPFSKYSSVSTFRPTGQQFRHFQTNPASVEPQEYLDENFKVSPEVKENISFWENFLNVEQQKNTELKSKTAVLIESINLYKETLKLKNEEMLNLQNAVDASDCKIVSLTKEVKEGEKKQKKLGQKCIEIRKKVEEARESIQKEENVLVEEEKHAQQIYEKMCKMEQYIKNSYNELDKKQELYERYLSAVDENKQLKGKVHHLGNNIVLIQHEQNKNQKQEQALQMKTDELARIVQMRQSKNRGLSKRLIELKRFQYSPIPNSKGEIQELKNTLLNLQNQYSTLHEQLFHFCDSVQKLNEKIAQKTYKIKKMQKPMRIQESQSPLTMSRKAEKAPTQINTYKIIESQEDERPTTLKQQLKNRSEMEESPKKIGLHLESIRDEQKRGDLQFSESVKQLIERYEKVGNRHKKMEFM